MPIELSNWYKNGIILLRIIIQLLFILKYLTWEFLMIIKIRQNSEN
jgi:hypothetical protein